MTFKLRCRGISQENNLGTLATRNFSPAFKKAVERQAKAAPAPKRKKHTKQPPQSADPKHWDKVLRDHRLGMGRGRRDWLVYGCEYFDALASQEDGNVEFSSYGCGGGRRVMAKPSMDHMDD